MEFNIKEELKKLPDKPGVYIMHDASDEIIYVGKAVVLKNRVRQYFQSSRNHTQKIRNMVSKVAWFEYIVVDSETEALVLECNLIKEHRPKYNTMLKDDKHYPYILLTSREKFPRLLIARERKKDGGEYYGPYPSALGGTLDLLRNSCNIRKCNRKLDGSRAVERPCLYHSMGQCLAPCMGNVTPEAYAEGVGLCRSFLNGRYEPVTEKLEKRMNAYSEMLEFERAAEMRDLITGVKNLSNKQKADECDFNDRDIVAVSAREDSAVCVVFFMREGKILGREHHFMTGVENESEEDILESFIKQYYSGTPHIPKEIYVSREIAGAEVISEMLSRIRGNRVAVVNPKRGEKLRLVSMAESNALTVLRNDEKRIAEHEKKTLGALSEIRELLNLDRLFRIESYDISNTSGFENVASMVVFEGGEAKKSDYRRFKIRSFTGADDFRSMKEVLTRRFEHGLSEIGKEDADGTDSFVRFPDLLLIDGGRGQVNAVISVVLSLGLDIPVCGMVKDDRHRTRGLWFDDTEVPIDRMSEGFKLVTRIQDETHRFAIEYHRSLRGKAQTKSVLDGIPGIGEKRRVELLRHYDSLDRLREAEIDELAALPNMNRRAAESVYEYFHHTEE